MAVTPPPGAPLLEGRRLEKGTRPGAGECTYTVADLPRPVAAGGEKRSGSRQRTRLRTGKIINPDGCFLTECLVYDRSETGGRLRLPAGIALTRSIQLYDDQSATLFQADVVWRLARDVGVRFKPSVPTARSRALEAEMRQRFYAVRG